VPGGSEMGQFSVASSRHNGVQTVFNLAAYLNARKTRPPNPAGGKNGHPAKAGHVILEYFFTLFEAWACRQTIPRWENFIFGKKNA
jgi:hypothetical protein